MKSLSSKKRLLITSSIVLLASAAIASVVGFKAFHVRSDARPGKQAGGGTLVVTQQILAPWTPERYIQGRPVDMAFNRDLSQLAVLNAASIELFDEKTGAQKTIKTATTSYCGIVFTPDNSEIWASEAARNGHAAIFIHKLSETGKHSAKDDIALPKESLPAGIAFSGDGRLAYVALNGRNAVAVLDRETHKLLREIPVGLAPLFVKLSKDGSRLFVSNRGGREPEKGVQTGLSAGQAMATDASGAVLNGTISIIDLKTNAVVEKEVGRAPSALALSPNGKTLAITNSHSDSVTLLDVDTYAIKTVQVPTMPDHLLGTVPTAAIFSPDGQWLYVAAALNNAVIVLQHKGATYEVAGAIPTGWFPGALSFDSHHQLAVLNVKGRGNTIADKNMNAPAGASTDSAHNTRSYEGSLLRLPVLSTEQLKVATQMVIAANNPQFDPAGGIANLATLGIKHVILIVRENRTYDQVLGDIGKGNSDPNFTMFGREVTPNGHALAEKYVLLDNFYATGAISFDGHQWLEQGFVSDNMERSANGPRGYAYNLSDALDVSPAGFIWEHPQRPLDVRIGGILSNLTEHHQRGPKNPDAKIMQDIDFGKAAGWIKAWDLYKTNRWRGVYGSKSAVPALANIMNTAYPGSSAGVPDQIRATVFEEEIAAAEKSGHLPDLIAYGLPCDHTMGTAPGAPTPRAMVADNDYALGRMVAAVSHSKFWAETLILVVEDDAQNGTDHVDGHRTVALAIGPMVKRNTIDSNFYTQLSMARTLQDILHVEPRTHFLKNARPMNTIFTAQKDLSAFTAIEPKIALDTMNPGVAALTGQAKADAIASSRMDWKELDDVPSQILNRILWASVKGYTNPMPPPRHAINPDTH